MRLTVLLLALLCGCASPHGLKLIDAKDGKRAPWAEARTSFQPTDPFLALIRGYGGRKVTLELWREPNQKVGSATHDIPARKTYRSYDGLAFDTRWREVELAEWETFYWTSTDYVLQFKPLPPGSYELRLQADNGQKESAKFSIQSQP
ncbi:MAG TPA: hypothetical protein VFC26_03535 [Verrucomicrobiae bacterium]|nr:hypothetical protein [Verrucomicrobiae bacterium]